VGKETYRLEKEVSQGKKHSDIHLERVAEIYLTAYVNRVSAQREVAQSLGIAVSTAAKQIMFARSSGLIPSREKLTKMMKEHNETIEKIRMSKAIINS